MDEGLLGNFCVGETLALEHCDAVVDGAATILYNKYIEQKSFTFAVDNAIDHLFAEIAMACQPVPRAPSKEWTMEEPPAQSQIDSWARSFVPSRKPTETKKKETPKVTPTTTGRKGTVLGSRSPPSGASEEAVVRIWSIQSPVHIDPEETALREMKEREMKEKKEESERVSEKIKEAEAKETKPVKVKEEVNTKPYTYDSEGNILWVQPPNPEKLPNSMHEMSVKLSTKGGGKVEITPRGVKVDTTPRAPKSDTTPRFASKPKAKAKKAPEHKGIHDVQDGILRLASQQPSMIEAMEMTPGVSLQEKGRIKAAPMNTNGNMTRGEYMKLVNKSGTGMSGMKAALDMQVETSLETQEFPMSAFHSDYPSPAGSPHGFLDAGDDMDSPSMEQRQSTIVPPSGSIHSAKNKRLAIGFRLGKRDRLPIAGTARLSQRGAQCVGPQPPFGATMGHGLMGEHDEFYFPNEPIVLDDSDSPKSSPTKKVLRPLVDPRHKRGGKLVRNPQLVAQLNTG